ncbi:MAG: succinate dehydrogenase, cytochrome b556 subunit [Burkholderiaceae bacterium]
MSDLTRPVRPIHRNINIGQIVAYRLPAAGLISILHRISGFMMFVLLPFVLYLLDKSLTSEISFDTFKSVTSNWFVKLVLLALIWAYLHHFIAGIRHLFMDMHLFLEKDSSRTSALVVFAISLVLWAAFALKTFGAF